MNVGRRRGRMARRPWIAGKMAMNILFICTGNICRSPMAEGLFRHMLPPEMRSEVHVHSAGTHGLDGEPAAPYAVQAAARMGVDISRHRARSLDPEMVRQADIIFVMEPFHRDIVIRALPAENRHRVQLLATFDKPSGEDTIDDPYSKPLEAYQICLEKIQRCLGGFLARMPPEWHLKRAFSP
jgi:protein-tyrosine phosphatase